MLVFEKVVAFTLFLSIGEPSLSSEFVMTRTTEEQQERVFLQKCYQMSFKVCKKNICQMPGQYAFGKLWQRCELRRCACKIEADASFTYSRKCSTTYIILTSTGAVSANLAWTCMWTATTFGHIWVTSWLASRHIDLVTPRCQCEHALSIQPKKHKKNWSVHYGIFYYTILTQTFIYII